MNLGNVYLYIILVVLMLLIIFYIRRKKANIEHFNQLNLPSFNNFMKITKGYNCDNGLDTLDLEVEESYNIDSFCRQYPNSITIDKLSTELLNKNEVVNRKSLNKLKTSDVNVRSVFSGKYKTDSMNGNINNQSNKLSTSLMKDECMEKCSSDPLCQYIVVGKTDNNNLGKCDIYRNVNNIKIVNDPKNEVYSKINNIEYSVVFWIKINDFSNNIRNILHHGSNENNRYPSISLQPKTNSLIFSITTNKSSEISNGINSITNENMIISRNVIPMKKWFHVAFTLNAGEIICYINGNKIATYTCIGLPIWPENQDLFIVNPWSAINGYELSKIKWYPFELTNSYVEYLAYSSFPLDKFDKSISILNGVTNETIQLLNNWEEETRDGFESLRAKNYNGIIFIDGYIKNGNINQPFGLLPESCHPDRIIEMPVGYSDGMLRIKILPNGQMEIYDNTAKNSNNMLSKYNKPNVVILSNLRFPQKSGTNLILEKNITSNESLAIPSYTIKGSMVYLSGGIKNAMNNKIANIPSNAIPNKGSMHTTLGDSGKLSYITVNNVGTQVSYNANGNQNNMSLEGVNYSTFRGEKLPLANGAVNLASDKGSWDQASVVLDNNVVKLSGIIQMTFKSLNKKYITRKGCFSDNPNNRDLPNMRGSGMTMMSCAAQAFNNGDRYFGLQNRGQCWTGNNYGKHGKSSDCNLACGPGNVNEQSENNCGGVSSNNIYEIANHYIQISQLPEKYCPTANYIFPCNSTDGISYILITVDGEVYYLYTFFTNSLYISLNSISYLIDTDIEVKRNIKQLVDTFSPRDCLVGDWSTWSACSKTCGSGVQTRTRLVIKEPANNGKACPVLAESQPCNIQSCAVITPPPQVVPPPQPQVIPQPQLPPPIPDINCEVSGWSNWSTCSKTCGGGTQTRTRTITKQPSGKGQACPPLSESQSCNTQACIDINSRPTRVDFTGRQVNFYSNFTTNGSEFNVDYSIISVAPWTFTDPNWRFPLVGLLVKVKNWTNTPMDIYCDIRGFRLIQTKESSGMVELVAQTRKSGLDMRQTYVNVPANSESTINFISRGLTYDGSGVYPVYNGQGFIKISNRPI